MQFNLISIHVYFYQKILFHIICCAVHYLTSQRQIEIEFACHHLSLAQCQNFNLCAHKQNEDILNSNKFTLPRKTFCVDVPLRIRSAIGEYENVFQPHHELEQFIHSKQTDVFAVVFSHFILLFLCLDSLFIAYYQFCSCSCCVLNIDHCIEMKINRSGMKEKQRKRERENYS